MHGVSYAKKSRLQDIALLSGDIEKCEAFLDWELDKKANSLLKASNFNCSQAEFAILKCGLLRKGF